MEDEEVRPLEDRAPVQNSPNRRWIIWLGALLAAFLLGLVPMGLSNRSLNTSLDQTKRELQRSKLQNGLAAAAVYARRGEYETARQNASSFFTDVQAELDNANAAILSGAEKTLMPPLLASRDDIITLLSRGDPASGERLSDVYVEYRAATATAAPRQ